MSTYNREWYLAHKKEHIASIIKYHRTEKGKKSKLRSMKKILKKDPDYFKNYFKERRLCAKEQGICMRCMNDIIVKGKFQCKKCLRWHEDYKSKKTR